MNIKKLKKLLYISSCFLFSSIAVLFSLEFFYRFQIIDTYAAELRFFNIEDDLKDTSKKRKTILILGDSFSASNRGYVQIMRSLLSGYRIVNSAVSGTGIVQAQIMAPKRFERFRPSIFIYQVYIGNDLFDIRYPVNWETSSWTRNAYWFTANYFRVVSFLNYRTGQLWAQKPAEDVAEVAFSPGKYSEREKIRIQAEPWLLENEILVRRNRKDDFTVFLYKLNDLVSNCDPNECEVYILLIPSKCQANESYLKQIISLGARLGDPKEILEDEYPFIKGVRQNFGENPRVHILNPLRTLKEKEARGIKMFYQNDEHLNSAGQRVLGEFVVDQIKLTQSIGQ